MRLRPAESQPVTRPIHEQVSCRMMKQIPPTANYRESPQVWPSPEKWIPVFRKACPRARPEGSCSNNNLERDDDSKKSHLALAAQSDQSPSCAAGGSGCGLNP